jgi:hypothetical protein
MIRVALTTSIAVFVNFSPSTAPSCGVSFPRRVEPVERRAGGPSLAPGPCAEMRVERQDGGEQ